MDCVEVAAKHLCVSVRHIFHNAIAGLDFSDREQCERDRFERWIKYGQIPPWVERYCLELKEKDNEKRIFSGID